MSIPILIYGKSGSGKSTSMRNLDPAKTGLISVLGKPLPFRGKLTEIRCDDCNKIIDIIARGNRDVYVIDDAGYLFTNPFMRGHSEKGGGSAKFDFYNRLADDFWRLLDVIPRIPNQSRVYIIMHEDKSDSGDVIPKTIGKLINEKVCLEGMVTICLRCMLSGGKHIFRTQSDGYDVAKSPMEMFDELEIDNDLSAVDAIICEYYNIGGNEQ